MPELTSASFLLSCFISRQKALEIEGDLLEERSAHSWFWFQLQIISISFSYLKYGFTRAPYRNLAMGLLAVFSSSLVTLFLLVPLMLKHVDLTLLPLLIVFMAFRALACFVVGATLSEYGGRHAFCGMFCSALMFLTLMILRLLALSQEVILPGPDSLGLLQTAVFYIPCSIIALFAGGFYIHKNLQSEEQLQDGKRIGAV